MPDRKQFVASPPADKEFLAKIEKARSQEVSEEELHEQRISFAYGNAMQTEKITKDSVRHASEHIRLKS